ncbi:MAG: DUF116 domain-containing protein, partial [Methanocorpusculum sp.]|nr:DUF116 domain-containing protein [Methanocorpusculum sp.]
MAAIISLAFFDSPVWNNIVYILGELLVIMLAVWLILSILLGVLIVLSIRRKRMYFPRLLRPFLTAMEGTVRVVCMVLGVDSAQLMEFLFYIDNHMNTGDLAR